MIQTKVYIYRGIPGSGKTTDIDRETKRLVQQGTDPADIVFCSADHHATDPKTGEYSFNKKKHGEAHRQCYIKFLRYLNPLDPGPRPKFVFVDNTNIHLWHLSPYVNICLAWEADYVIRTMQATPEVGRRNIHGVPQPVVERMWKELQNTPLPRFWNQEVPESSWEVLDQKYNRTIWHCRGLKWRSLNQLQTGD